MKTLHMLHELETGIGEETSTVRLGFKWADMEWFEPIELCVCDEKGNHRIAGEGKVIGLWVGYFYQIPAILIANEHEVSSRNYNGLMESMKKAYGDKFKQNSFVTVLQYRRVK